MRAVFQKLTRLVNSAQRCTVSDFSFCAFLQLSAFLCILRLWYQALFVLTLLRYQSCCTHTGRTPMQSYTQCCTHHATLHTSCLTSSMLKKGYCVSLAAVQHRWCSFTTAKHQKHAMLWPFSFCQEPSHRQKLSPKQKQNHVLHILTCLARR